MRGAPEVKAAQSFVRSVVALPVWFAASGGRSLRAAAVRCEMLAANDALLGRSLRCKRLDREPLRLAREPATGGVRRVLWLPTQER